MLHIYPVTYRFACEFIRKHHRHHGAPQGHKFSIACFETNRIVGVATVGRPVSRYLDNGTTAEVTRLCTDGTRNACSKLYAACRRIVREMGYATIITYTLDTELGTSLIAAGWKKAEGTFGGRNWNVPGRPRTIKCPQQFKHKYYSELAGEHVNPPPYLIRI